MSDAIKYGADRDVGDVEGMTLGRLFRQTREARGIPIERVAHETRIRAACLRDLECDNHSQMSPAYARLFVRDYARYLNLNAGDIGPYLPEPGAFGVEGYDYLRNSSGPGPHIPKRHIPRRTKRKALMGVAAALVLAALGFQGYILLKKLEAINAQGSGAGETAPAITLSAEVVTSPDPRTAEIQEFRAVGEEHEDASRPVKIPSAPAAPPVPERSSDPHAADSYFAHGLAERGADDR